LDRDNDGIGCEVTAARATSTRTTASTSTPPPTTTPATTTPATTPPTTPSSSGGFYANCDEAHQAGAAPILQGQAGYRAALDRDGDGIACET
jgi:hypothetical protein